MINQEELKQKILNEVKVLLLQHLSFQYDSKKGLEINLQKISETISEYFLQEYLQETLTEKDIGRYYEGANKVLETLEKEAISTRARFPRESEFWLDKLRKTRLQLTKQKQNDQST
jgi:hypothetical protein